jgi:acetate CoA/acetoacetate CoA-transferase alpha subunit
MNKIISLDEAVEKVNDGDTVMVGGFLGVGTPEKLIDALVAKGTRDLTLICNDTAFIDRGVGKMVVAKLFKKIIVSHIGTNKETGRQMLAGETEVELVPQGTLIERIRAGGFGLGGVLTKTGLGTEVAKGKQIVQVDGEDYLLETPLRANVALLYANKVDTEGNLSFHGATRNFNVFMGSAAKISIVEAGEIIREGFIDPDHVVVPGVFVKYIVDGGTL